MINREKKSVLILGASSDIGVNLISQLIKKNYFIIAHYNSTKKKLSKFSNDKVKIFKSDFSLINDTNLKKLNKQIKNYNVSVIINLIGYIDNKNYFNSTLVSLEKSFKANSFVPNLIIRNQLNFMKKKRFGRIINCSSIGIKFGGGKNSYNYSFSKYASEFIPSELRYLAKYNVFINNLRLGMINTKIHKKLKRNKKELNYRLNLIPANRIAEPNEITNYILFFISDNNSFLTRETISISGGE